MASRILAPFAWAGVALAAGSWQAPPPSQDPAPTAGIVITKSTKFRAGKYRLPAPKDGPVLTIRGDGITIDMTGVTLEGADPLADPDRFTGTAILVDGGTQVTIRGAVIRGYKVGIHGRKSPGLHLSSNDLSYNWKARLWSGIEHESLVDWLTHHDNDKDEWLRYGAGIYLSECDGAEIDNNRAVQGQNGLMVTRSNKLKIWNNTFSWLSGLGIGLYRTSDSVIYSNKLDWDVRGYSHGYYNRGQDSAALLMYEQSSRNSVTSNSATHGGDGVFLWAGQSTLDSGKGGSNDNDFYDNDFSHAVANGIEATFSSNKFEGNRIEECWHGIWAGYSYDSQIIGNKFAKNTEGIAIEHGQNIQIIGNRFENDETAIRLWANAAQDPSWGYPKTRDTRSRDYAITGNTFSGTKTVLSLLRTVGVRAETNGYVNAGVPLQAGMGVSEVVFEPAKSSANLNPSGPSRPAPPVGMSAKLAEGALRGRSTIIVDEWGPYDYLSPKLWPVAKPDDRPLRLKVLGPAGKWTLKAIRGATPSAKDGVVPGEITLTPVSGAIDYGVTLDYVGAAVVTPRGQSFAAGTHVPVSYYFVDAPADWVVRYWRFDAGSHPVRSPTAFAAVLKTAPLKTEAVARLDIFTSGPISAGVPADAVALQAEGQIVLPSDISEMSVISDDGVRVWLDDKLVVDRWSVHESMVDRVPLTPGRHRLRVDYFDAAGWAELQVRFWRKDQ